MAKYRSFVGDEIGLKQIVRALNEGPAYSAHLTADSLARLRRTVLLWLESGPNLQKMKGNPGDPTFAEMADSYQGWIVAGTIQTGMAGARMIPIPFVAGDGTVDAASHFFLQLILNPLCKRLAAPCLNCHEWYIKKTLRKTVFCNRKCSEKRKLAQKRERNYKAKVNCAQKAIDNYRTRPLKFASHDWKQWVMEAEPTITSNFLTHAVKLGNLLPPS